MIRAITILLLCAGCASPPMAWQEVYAAPRWVCRDDGCVQLYQYTYPVLGEVRGREVRP